MQCLAIGGIFAYVLFKEKTTLLTIIFNKYIQLLSLIIILTIAISGIYIYNIDDEVSSVLFGIVVINAAANPKTIFKLEYPILNYFGKISYGIYMYHMLIIIVYTYFAGKERSHFADYLVIVSCTLLISVISHEFFEKKFLKLKNKFSFIKSGLL